MSAQGGSIALHGGHEYRPGDEPFLRELLRLAAARPGRRDRSDPIRVSIVPTAAARGRPERAAAEGVEAFQRVARDVVLLTGRGVETMVIRVVDAVSAADPMLADALRISDVIHFPGGDPDLIPTILRGTPVWAAILETLGTGAILAGASAGAMALGEVTWTPDGLIPGLGLVPGVVIAPHADADTWDRVVQRYASGLSAPVGILGIAEQTGVIVGSDGMWRVVGQGEVRWAAPGTSEVLIVTDGATFRP